VWAGTTSTVTVVSKCARCTPMQNMDQNDWKLYAKNVCSTTGEMAT